MDYSTLSLIELKKAAKEHRPPIKYYYVKSRKELVEILSRKEMTETMVKEKLTIQELRRMALARNIPNIWRMRRAQLMGLLYPDPKENDQNDDHTEEHDNPKTCKSE
jgi:hypothetical protein